MELKTESENEIKKDHKNQIIQNKNEIEEEKQKNENIDKEDKKNNKKKFIIISIISLIILIFAILFCTIFSLLNINSDKIIEGIFVNGIDVSGLTKDEAKEKLQKICDEKIKNEINIKYKDYESNINLELIEVKYDIDNAINKAYDFGRTGNIFENNFTILKNKINKEDIKLEILLNEEVAINTINDIALNIPGYVVEASYYIEDNNLIITKGKEGIVVDSESLLNSIYEQLSKINLNKDYIEIPVIEKSPEKIEIDKIYEEVHKEAKDAYYTKDPFTIYPEVNGIDFDIEEAKEILKEEKEEYIIKLIITKPNKTIKEIGTEAFPDLLGTCSTNYNAGDTNRTTNLRLASNKINGVVLMPGEEFSYNKTVGERTIEAGYKEASIFSNGEVIPGLGGGICQISSTLYNAVVFADLNVTVRRNHQFVTSYLPAGRDATVVWGSQDFKFKNNRSYPIRIVSSVNGGIAKVSIYGIKEDTEYDISIETKQISTISYSTVYKEDSTMLAGTEKVKQNGAVGRIVESYKVKKLNGTVVSKTLLSKDTYNAKQKIILRGTKETTPVMPTTPSNTTVTIETPSTTPNEDTQEPIDTEIIN